jgi:hypothetical protein
LPYLPGLPLAARQIDDPRQRLAEYNVSMDARRQQALGLALLALLILLFVILRRFWSGA